MLSPKRTKFRKAMKGHMRGRAKGGDSVSFGDYALQATECGRITSRQIEAARVAITRHVKRGGKLYIRIFPDKPTTKKPAETRTGKGNGANEEWGCACPPGAFLDGREGVAETLARAAFHLADHKLPVGTKVVSREPVL